MGYECQGKAEELAVHAHDGAVCGPGAVRGSWEHKALVLVPVGEDYAKRGQVFVALPSMPDATLRDSRFVGYFWSTRLRLRL